MGQGHFIDRFFENFFGERLRGREFVFSADRQSLLKDFFVNPKTDILSIWWTSAWHG